MGTVRLTVAELPEGGFVVLDPAPVPGVMDTPMFAASTVEDALAYMRKRLRREREAEKPSGDPTRPRHETAADTADMNQYGRNALAHAVNLRRA